MNWWEQERHEDTEPEAVEWVHVPVPRGVTAEWMGPDKQPDWLRCKLVVHNTEQLIEWLKSTGKQRIVLDVTNRKGVLFIKENTWKPG